MFDIWFIYPKSEFVIQIYVYRDYFQKFDGSLYDFVKLCKTYLDMKLSLEFLSGCIEATTDTNNWIECFLIKENIDLIIKTIICI